MFLLSATLSVTATIKGLVEANLYFLLCLASTLLFGLPRTYSFWHYDRCIGDRLSVVLDLVNDHPSRDTLRHLVCSKRARDRFFLEPPTDDRPLHVSVAQLCRLPGAIFRASVLADYKMRWIRHRHRRHVDHILRMPKLGFLSSHMSHVHGGDTDTLPRSCAFEPSLAFWYNLFDSWYIPQIVPLAVFDGMRDVNGSTPRTEFGRIHEGIQWPFLRTLRNP
jgi:hypothetical protein